MTNSDTFDLPFGIFIAIAATAIHAFILPYKDFALDVLQMCVLSNQVLVLFSMYVDQYADFGIQMGYCVTALQFVLLAIFLYYLVPFFWMQFKGLLEMRMENLGKGQDEETEADANANADGEDERTAPDEM